MIKVHIVLQSDYTENTVEQVRTRVSSINEYRLARFGIVTGFTELDQVEALQQITCVESVVQDLPRSV